MSYYNDTGVVFSQVLVDGYVPADNPVGSLRTRLFASTSQPVSLILSKQ